MSWTEKETLAAAGQVATLSALMEREGYDDSAVAWLTPSHVRKFVETVDEEEAAKLKTNANKWFWTGQRHTQGFPLLSWLWVAGPERIRWNISTSDQPGTGRILVARLAAFEPDWVGRWWQWRCENDRGISTDPLTAAMISALTLSDLENHQLDLGDQVVAGIVGAQPRLLAALPPARRGEPLSLALGTTFQEPDMVGALSHFGLPSDVAALVDRILESEEERSALQLLDQLVKKWEGPVGSDPVSRAISAGHEQAAMLLRSPWHQPHPESGRGRAPDVWAVGPPWQSVGPAFGVAALAAPGLFELELGFTIGTRLSGEGREPTADEVHRHLKTFHPEATPALVESVLPMARLWAALRTLAKYQSESWKHDTELVGLRAKIAALAAEAPGLWAHALRWILLRAEVLGETAQAVTLELAATTSVVRAALESACDDEAEAVRLLARGLWTLLNGLTDPAPGLARTLADAAARHMDGVPVFPHPLAPMSTTWLGSTGIESAIADGVKRAANRFAIEVRDQGGDIEEALAKALVKEIEVEFRQIQPQLSLLSPGRYRSQAPLLSVRQRPASKQVEEPVYGCDIAWLLNAEVRGRYSATWVDLVQIKKSTAIQYQPSGKRSADSWRIDCHQLGTILRWSMTATYWLIAAAGEILVVPARHLVAIQHGSLKRLRGKSFTAGYHEVRSAAIPLEQYLVDLLIGQWIGTTEERVLRFARGEDSNIRPRLVVEVTIAVGEQAG